MTPQELKNSILQLAIQGKLVEQRQEEGTAEELFRQIQAEKQALVKVGKIKKEKPMPEISEDERPFDIPESWMWCYVGDLFQHNTGKALNSSNKSGTPMKYITTSNLYWDHFELDKLKEMPFTESEVEKCTVEKGDLLVCEGGDYGRSAIWPYDFPMRIQNHIHRLRAYGPISNQFFYYVFFLYKNAGMISGKGIGIQGLSSNALHALKMPLPPLLEQKRIVAKIEEITPLIARYEHAWSRLEDFNKRFPGDMKKSILQMAIQGKLVPQCDADSPVDLSALKMKPTEEYEFELPNNWAIGHLESVTDSIPSKPYQILESEVLKEGSYAVISQSKEYSIGYSNESRKVFHHIDPVVAFGDHTTEIKYIDFDFVVGADGVKIFAPKSFLLPKYFFYVMKYLCIGLNKKGGYSRHYKYIKDKPIPIPPLAEQKRIVARIEELLPLCEQL